MSHPGYGQSCIRSEDCELANSICENNKCQCETLFQYESTIGKCQPLCDNHRQCRRFDRNMACDLSSRRCLCALGFTYDGNMCQSQLSGRSLCPNGYKWNARVS